ncbi:MAG: 6-pyruvoyl tetrahydropterin synthase family protein [Phycisphaerales bacterium]|nr:6-pyruvoyl tetrahydropterin synthase family protein [Phycisphaerales bacterium]
MYSISVGTSFTASHQLRLVGGNLEALHSHDWQVSASVQSPQLDAIETVMDFHAMEALIKAIVIPWHNRCLNDLEPFKERWNPSAERVAEHIARAMGPLLPEYISIWSVSVTEAPGCIATYRYERAADRPTAD